MTLKTKQMDLTPQKLTATALQTISKAGILKLTPTEAFKHGTNVRKAMRVAPQETRLTLVTLIGGLCQFIDAKRTITTDTDLIFTVEAILEGYPALTLEELRLIVDGMKRGHYGKYYERLKLPEIEAAIQQYESTTKAEVLERIHTYKHVERGTDDPDKIKFEPQSMADLKRKRWFERFKPTTTGKGE